MEIIAHRGASHDAPENTLAAVQLGWAQGADAVEVDVQLSKDGRLVVIHDDNTRKTCGLNQKVCRQTLAELRQLDAGRWKDPRWTGERVPTLPEVLETVPRHKRLFVEIKCGPECVPAFARDVRDSKLRPQQVVPIGFALETMRRIKQALTAWHVCLVAEFKRRWHPRRWRPTPADLAASVTGAGLDGVDLGAQGPLTPALVRQVHEAGLKCYVWTVDSPAQARKLAAAGIDGITTNRPGWLREHLQ